MFDGRKFYEEFNSLVIEKYPEIIKRISEIYEETKGNENINPHANIVRYVSHCANFMHEMMLIGEKLSTEEGFKKFFENQSMVELAKLNDFMFGELRGDKFESSYANPEFCVRKFGDIRADGFGQLLSGFYMDIRQFITYAPTQCIYKMANLAEKLIKLHEYVKDNSNPQIGDLIEIIHADKRVDSTTNRTCQYLSSFSKDFGYYKDIADTADLTDLRYLYMYFSNITENEIKIAQFLNNYPDDKIDILADVILKGYINGFERDGKDISKRSAAMLSFGAGYERINRVLMKKMRDQGLEPLVSGVSSTPANKQYSYDHRFDNAIYLDENYTKLALESQLKALENVKEHFEHSSGIILFDTFGDKPFSPKSKSANLSLSNDQQKIWQSFQHNAMMNQNKYYPRSERSFTIIAFPSPEIGEKFEEIFEDICRVNMLDSDTWMPIQQKIIDVLDKAEKVHVRGAKGNKTDIVVSMPKINNPEKETNFVNCGADVNIPVGEVFTSPKLTGTNGMLHVKETFLRGLRYDNLQLVFKDGFIADYTCSNFDKEDDNRKYVHENLIQPNETLPIGEFAIGTNTLAYVIAQKYQILDVLPILIIEKMGPHFAVGDTCFTFEEDKPVFNDDGKEIIARDNEKTILRKEDPSKAYCGTHTDITLPYESLEFITAILPDGSKEDIIRDGRFVVPGTEKLNEPFDE